VFPKKQWDST